MGLSLSIPPAPVLTEDFFFYLRHCKTQLPLMNEHKQMSSCIKKQDFQSKGMFTSKSNHHKSYKFPKSTYN